MKGPFALYAMEKEGLLNTRESKINRAIKRLVACKDPNKLQYQILQDCGLADITQDEADRIQKEVNRQRKLV